MMCVTLRDIRCCGVELYFIAVMLLVQPGHEAAVGPSQHAQHASREAPSRMGFASHSDDHKSQMYVQARVSPLITYHRRATHASDGRISAGAPLE